MSSPLHGASRHVSTAAPRPPGPTHCTFNRMVGSSVVMTMNEAHLTEGRFKGHEAAPKGMQGPRPHIQLLNVYTLLSCSKDAA